MNKQLDVPYLPPADWSKSGFDMVEGPLFREINRHKEIFHWEHRANQISIHSTGASDLFNEYMNR